MICPLCCSWERGHYKFESVTFSIGSLLPATTVFSSIPTLLSWWFHEGSSLPAVPSLCPTHGSPSQVMAVQTQFPQAQTQRLQSTSVSAPSAYVSSSRAHSVGTRNKGQQLRVKVEYSILASLGTLPFSPDKTYLASEAPYLSKGYHPPKDLGTRTSPSRWWAGA